jgi:hypothetical protein
MVRDQVSGAVDEVAHSQKRRGLEEFMSALCVPRTKSGHSGVLLLWLRSMSAHSGGFRGQGKRGPLLQNLVLLRNTPVA